MEEVLVPIFVVAIIFGSIPGMIVALIYLKNRRIERTALIAAGLDAKIFKEEDKKSTIHNALKIGILGVGIGLGIITGDILAKSSSLEEAAAYFSMIFIFGGISLLIYYLIQRKIEAQN